ncbi:MAG TPA: calcium-binding protein, partial [Thermomicrobiales bacterium]|nr:calcium-binding protein [Thermomicrobiales bacterium]
AAAIDLTGNELSQTIHGNAGNNVIEGGGGNDTLAGLGGDDMYVVDSASDRAIEAAGEGADRVYTRTSYTLGGGQEIEYFATTGNGGTDPIDLTGNELSQTIHGNAGDNVLDSGGGGDTLAGLGGDDMYIPDSASDRVIEAAGEGADRVYTRTSYTLGGGQEIEYFATSSNGGTANIDLTGNELSQTIHGNAGNNVIQGGGGSDTMAGLGGDDRYKLDNAGDRVIEAADGGFDRVYARISYTLGGGEEIEYFATTGNGGTDPIDLTGNEFSQTIHGNAGDNVIEGGGGNDTMAGLGGDDAYVVDSASDKVIEAAGGGFDRVYARTSYTLARGQEIEYVATTGNGGTANINLVGDEFSQTIHGNAGSNVLDGKGG